MRTIIVAGIILLSACVPRSSVKKGYDEGYNKAKGECAQAVNYLYGQVLERNERLKKFNQVDEKGMLR